MRVNEIRYSMTRQVRQYEPERLEIVVEVDPDEQPGEAVQRARSFCLRFFREQPMLPEEIARMNALGLHHAPEGGV
jgi:hypothetical protein